MHIPNRIHDVAVQMRSAKKDLQNKIRIATALLYSSLLCSTSTPALLLLYLCLCLLTYFAFICFYPTSTSTLPLFDFTQVRLLYSTSTGPYATLPLLYLFSTPRRRVFTSLLYLYCALRYSTSTSTLPLLCFTQVPTGHNDIWASENVAL